MTKWESKTVEQFKVGDRIRVHGFDGWVAEVSHETRYETNWKTGERTNPQECTYVRVNFDEPKKVGYQYEGGWYGGLDGVVAYGFGREVLPAGFGILC